MWSTFKGFWEWESFCQWEDAILYGFPFFAFSLRALLFKFDRYVGNKSVNEKTLMRKLRDEILVRIFYQIVFVVMFRAFKIFKRSTSFLSKSDGVPLIGYTTLLLNESILSYILVSSIKVVTDWLNFGWGEELENRSLERLNFEKFDSPYFSSK